MFRITYRQLFSFSFLKVLVRYSNRKWLRAKFQWSAPFLTRDFCGAVFVFSFCFVKHSSSHFLLLYVIISVTIYYFWVRFQQLKYTESLPGKLQNRWNLCFDIRYLYRIVPRSTKFAGFFAYFSILGIYLFYAGKSILLITDPTGASEVGSVKGGPWIQLAKTSTAGFFPISITSLIHLQCVGNPLQRQLKSPNSIPAEFLGKYWCFAYTFHNMGGAPFFGRFTNDLEILKFLGNFQFEKFSLFEFYNFTVQTVCRIWLPVIFGGYNQLLAWAVHPHYPEALLNIRLKHRFFFDQFANALIFVFPTSQQQIEATFQMNRWVWPVYDFWESHLALLGSQQTLIERIVAGDLIETHLASLLPTNLVFPAWVTAATKVMLAKKLVVGMQLILGAKVMLLKLLTMIYFFVGYQMNYGPMHLLFQETRLNAFITAERMIADFFTKWFIQPVTKWVIQPLFLILNYYHHIFVEFAKQIFLILYLIFQHLFKSLGFTLLFMNSVLENKVFSGNIFADVMFSFLDKYFYWIPMKRLHSTMFFSPFEKDPTVLALKGSNFIVSFASSFQIFLGWSSVSSFPQKILFNFLNFLCNEANLAEILRPF